MRTKLKTALLLSSLAIVNLASAQGNGNGIQREINCRPTVIVGEKNPTPGEVYTYEHDYSIENGEQFRWEVEGALKIDGQPTDADGSGEVVKGGNTVDVVWDGETPTGRLHVTPATPCAQYAQDGKIGGTIVAAITGLCPDAEIEGTDAVCPGKSYTYNFSYDINTDYTEGGLGWQFDGCEDVEWTIRGAESIILRGIFLTVEEEVVECTDHGDSMIFYTDNVIVAYQEHRILNPNSSYTFGESTVTPNICLQEPVTYRDGIINQIEVVWAANSNYDLSIFATGCETGGVCGTQRDELDVNAISPITGLNGPTFLGCGSNGVYYEIEGGYGSTKSWEFSNPLWTWDPVLIPIFSTPNSPTFESTNSFYLNTNGSGSGSITLTSTSSCGDTTILVETITIGEGTLTKAPSSIYSSLGTSFCENATVSFSAVGGSPTPEMQYQWELRKGNTVKEEYIGDYNLIGIKVGNIDNIRVRFITDCDYGPWTTLNLDIDLLPTRLYDIQLTGSMCPGEEYEFEVLYANQTHDYYEWDIFFSGSGSGGGTTQGNTFSGIVPSDADGNGVTVNVEAINNCGVSDYEKTFTSATGMPIISGIIMPDKYCGGTSNVFTVYPQDPGVEYEWYFMNDAIQQDNVIGFEAYEFTPDFGEDPTSNLNPKPGEVQVFEVGVRARTLCNDWTPYTTTPITNVVYNGCNNSGGGSTFSIKLLPNPAQDHVTVQFPNGGGDTKNIRIIDVYGVERKNVNTNSAAEMINTSNLQTGIYSVIATENSEIATKQLRVTR